MIETCCISSSTHNYFNLPRGKLFHAAEINQLQPMRELSVMSIHLLKPSEFKAC